MQWTKLDDSRRKKLLSDAVYLVESMAESSICQINQALRSEEGISSKLRGIQSIEAQQLDRFFMLIDDFEKDYDSVLLCLESASFVYNQVGLTENKIDLTYTGPIQFAVPGRSTGSVMKEMIRNAKKNVTIIDYIITEDEKEVAEELAKRIEDGVKVLLVIDNDKKGKNLDAIENIWKGLKPPTVFTRKKRSGDIYYKIHAKTIVVDSKDLLITSANLTWHGVNKNLEMGVRIRGKMAEQVELLVKELIETGYLEAM